MDRDGSCCAFTALAGRPPAPTPVGPSPSRGAACHRRRARSRRHELAIEISRVRQTALRSAAWEGGGGAATIPTMKGRWRTTTTFFLVACAVRQLLGDSLLYKRSVLRQKGRWDRAGAHLSFELAQISCFPESEGCRIDEISKHWASGSVHCALAALNSSCHEPLCQRCDMRPGCRL
eukprot:7376987-Prymnesium_polylepis.2